METTPLSSIEVERKINQLLEHDTETNVNELKALVYQYGIPEPIIPFVSSSLSSPSSVSSSVSNLRVTAASPNPANDVSVTLSTHPNTLRSAVWKRLLGVKVPIVTESEYSVLIQKGLSHSAHRIATDLPRTLRGERSIQPLLQSRTRLLNAFIHWEEQYLAQSSSSVSSSSSVLPSPESIKELFGYQQGMGSIVAIFLYIMNEYDAFVCFVHFITNCIPDFFLAGHNRVRQGCELADIVFTTIDPVLHEHFVRLYGSSTSNAELMFFSRIASLYSNRPPITNTIQLWDRILASGVYFAVICCVSECVLRRHELLIANRDAITRFQGIGSTSSTGKDNTDTATVSTVTKGKTEDTNSNVTTDLPVQDLISKTISILHSLPHELRTIVYNYTGNSNNSNKDILSSQPPINVSTISKYRIQQMHPSIHVAISTNNGKDITNTDIQSISLSVPQPTHGTFLSTGPTYPNTKYSTDVRNCKTPTNENTVSSGLNLSSSSTIEPAIEPETKLTVPKELYAFRDPPLSYAHTPSHIQLIHQPNISNTDDNELHGTNSKGEEEDVEGSVVEQSSVLEDDETLSDFTTPRSSVLNDTMDTVTHKYHPSMNFEGIDEEEGDAKGDTKTLNQDTDESPAQGTTRIPTTTTTTPGMTTINYNDWKKSISTTTTTTTSTAMMIDHPYHHHRYTKGYGSSVSSSTKSLIGSLSPSVAEALLLHEAFRDTSSTVSGSNYPINSTIDDNHNLSLSTGNSRRSSNTNNNSTVLMTSPHGIHNRYYGDSKDPMFASLPLATMIGTTNRTTMDNVTTTSTMVPSTNNALSGNELTVSSKTDSSSNSGSSSSGPAITNTELQVGSHPGEDVPNPSTNNYRHTRKYLSESAVITLIASSIDNIGSGGGPSSSGFLSHRTTVSLSCGQDASSSSSLHRRRSGGSYHSNGSGSQHSRNLSSIADALLNSDAEEEKYLSSLTSDNSSSSSATIAHHHPTTSQTSTC